MFKHILVPTDGSELSERAAAKAIEFARETGARITAFFSRAEYPVTYFGEGALIDPTSPETFAEMTRCQASEYLEAIAEHCRIAQVPCQTCSEINDTPYEAIIRAAEENACDLIFMASHGRRGITALLLGSETNKVLAHSRIPVLVFR